MNKKAISNVFWNMFGTGLPLVAAFLAVPHLVEAMSVERFGILTLSWVIVGYFSFFDFGLGRALTQLIAEKTGNNEHAEIPSIVRSGIILMAILGVVGGAFVALLSPWLVGSKLALPDALKDETLLAFYILAASIPIVIISTGLRGVLEGWQRFAIVNLVRAPIGVFTYMGPLLVLPFSNSLPSIVSALVLSRLVSGTIFAIICARIYPELTKRTSFNLPQLQKLLAFGGWMTLSNIAGPLLLYLGRFAIATSVSVEAIAYFSVPYDAVISLLLIPGVFVSALFPLFAKYFRTNKKYVEKIYHQSLVLTFLLIFPLCCIVYYFAEPVIAWWINEPFSQKSFRVAQFLAVGVFINSFGYMSQSLVQAYGRPDLTAKLHVLELIAYVPYLWLMVGWFELEGAAMAWVLRVSISTIVLAVLAHRCQTGAIKSN